MPNTNIKTIASWAVVIIIVVGSAWYVFSGSPKGNGGVSPVATTTASTQQGTNTPSHSYTVKSGSTTQRIVAPVSASAKIIGVTTLSYLFGLKQPLVCSVRTTGTSVQRSGTMYIADGEMRANFTSSSMIDDGTYLYAWQSDASKGLKLLAASSVSGSAIASNGGFDLSTILSFACNPWAKNPSVFVPPTSVSFSNSL
ncbi:MAG: hypothetical protein ACYC75_02085 [Minisyncoccota bacterium]